MSLSDSTSRLSRMMLYAYLVAPTVALMRELRTDAQDRYKLHMLTNKGALCLDGSDAGFYYAPSMKKGSRSWQIMLEGGAWCTKKEECVARSHTWLGSSRYWNNTYTKHDLSGIMSDNCHVNPDFCNFNRVLVPNCDGTSLTGNMGMAVEATEADGKPAKLHFRGFRILEAVLDTLLTRGLQTADTVMITGFSSGALAALVHADYIQEKLQASVKALKTYRVVPLSGFFLDHTSLVGLTKMYGENLANMARLANSTSVMDQECAQKFGPYASWNCIYATNAYNFVKVPTFMVNPGIDEWQIALQVKSVAEQEAMFTCMRSKDFTDCNTEQVSRLRKFHWDIEDKMKSLLKSSGNGAFVHSCPSHINALDDVEWNTLKIRGRSMQQAVSDWWHNNGDRSTMKHSTFDCHLSQTAPYTCNPTCRNQLPETQPAPVFDKGCLSVCKKLESDWQTKCSSKDFDFCHTCAQCANL